jgi:hypothetical protein
LLELMKDIAGVELEFGREHFRLGAQGQKRSSLSAMLRRQCLEFLFQTVHSLTLASGEGGALSPVGLGPG